MTTLQGHLADLLVTLQSQNRLDRFRGIDKLLTGRCKRALEFVFVLTCSCWDFTF